MKKVRFICTIAMFITIPVLTAQDSLIVESGYFDFAWSKDSDKIFLYVQKSRIGEEFLYVNGLTAGVGSNDLGLDRGQLGDSRIVKFIKTGNKLLLLQPNQDYKAISDNPKEVKAVEEAFAQSVLWGFKIESQTEEVYKIDLSPFILQDAHGVVGRLKSRNQGTYKLDGLRSGLWKENTMNFPKNTEFEAILTFTGEAQGGFIRSVTPSSDAVTVRQHHSFIELPDEQYSPRIYHPYSGYGFTSYYDYATPIYQPIQKRFIARHRLVKKNPEALRSEAVEPIVYYIDPGCPEPVKSALLEGASWWNTAFEAAGFINAFQVKELPDGAHPLDIRYNMIQWVHRSTRGWSYGASVRDPRTGEIIKGHVSLGSLRVRQDFMITQGLLSPFSDNDNNNEPMMEVALARLRQLSAHEVGHTIGLSHNFASSVNTRASVMDYPHPYVKLGPDGHLDFSDAYDTGIGDWDIRAIIYGYTEFGENENEPEKLTSIIEETQKMGLRFISDRDARPSGGAHPFGHLWDNGTSASEELSRLMDVRQNALTRLGENSITAGTPISELEKILVPIYLLHRYQIEATAKLLGGVNYNYSVKGDHLVHKVFPVEREIQKKSLEILLSTIHPEQLSVPSSLREYIPPYAPGFSRSRESFNSHTGLTFDPLAAAEGLSQHSISFMLNPQRLSRLFREDHSNAFNNPLAEYLQTISEFVFQQRNLGSHQAHIQLVTQQVYFTNLLKLFSDRRVEPVVAAIVKDELEHIKKSYLDSPVSGSISAAVHQFLNAQFETAVNKPGDLKLPDPEELPPGAPIGCQ